MDSSSRSNTILLVKEGLYRRIQTRPLLALGGLAVGLALAIVFGGEASPISKMAVGMAGSIMAVLLPFHRLRRSRTAGAEDPREAVS